MALTHNSHSARGRKFRLGSSGVYFVAMANHDPRQSPLQFIDIPSSSGLAPHATYAAMHPSLSTGPATPVRLRSGSAGPHHHQHQHSAQRPSSTPGLGPIPGASMSRGTIGYHQSPQPSPMIAGSLPGVGLHGMGHHIPSMVPTQQQVAPLSVTTTMGHHRSNSAQSIQTMMRDRSMENMALASRIPHPSATTPTYVADLDRPRPASARDHPYGDLGGGDFTTPRRMRDQRSYSPRTSSLERSGAPARHFNPGTTGRVGSNALRHQRSHSYDFSMERDPPVFGAPVGAGGIPGMPYHHVDGPLSAQASLDYQGDPMVMQRVTQELDLTKEKLGSCMNSIKTFWSPELKRERALRKEENAKYAALADQLHQSQIEKQSMLATLQNFEIELRRERELRAKASYTNQEYELLRRRCDELQKENRIFAKSQEELEARLNGQKQHLNSREESIRKMVEMLHSKGFRTDRIEEDRLEIERLRGQQYEYSCRVRDLERLIIERDADTSKTREELDSAMAELSQWKKENEGLRQERRQTQNIQSMLDTKDSKILTLESEIRLLEEELGRLRDDGIVTPTTSISSGIEDFDKIVQTMKSNERMLKSKVEMMTSELSKRDSEVYALQSRLEMSQKQQQDQTHHINVLKEQVKTREHKVSMLTADIEDLRKRVKEKETAVDKKVKQITSLQSERKQLEVEIKELKDQMDIKDRKVLVLQKKIENLEELLSDKENQLSTAKSRLSNLHSEHSSSAGARAGLEETIREKERQVERLKDQKQRLESDHQSEMEMQKKMNSELRSRLDTVQKELDEKHSSALEMREEVSELKSEKFKKDTEISQLQSQLSQKNAELSSVQMEFQLTKKQLVNETEFKANQRINDLECQVAHYMESAAKLQAEVDKLLNVMRSTDAERVDKERQIAELEEQVKDSQSKMNSMKRSQQTDRKKHAQMLEEARRREQDINVDTDYLKNSNEEKDSRIRELEMALKESVKITAEREVLLASKDDLNRQLEQQIHDCRQQLEIIQRERNSLSSQLSSVQEDLRDKEEQLKALENECFQGYIPELEKLRKMNQEANVRMDTLMKIIQGKESYLSEQDRINLQGISLYGDSPFKQTAGLSAFEKMQGPTTEVGRLNRLLQEKQQMLNQQMEELATLRFQNSELDARAKSLQREVEEKGKHASYMETHQFATTSTELTQLRQTNVDLNTKVMQLRKTVEEKEERMRQIQTECFSSQIAEIESLKVKNQELSSALIEKDTKLRDQFVELERIKRELTNTITDRDAHISILTNDVERLKKEKVDMNNNLVQFQQDNREKTDRIRLLEADSNKRSHDLEALQKKYQAVLGSLAERNERVQHLEKECFQVQADEIKRLRGENEEMNHRLSFMQKSLSDRDAKIDQLEKDHFKQREELSQIRKQFHCADAELKGLREELAYREERIKQLQNSHNEEITRLRSINQEMNARTSEMKGLLDEKELNLKSMHSENDTLRSEVEHMKRRAKDSESQIGRLTQDLALREERAKALENEVYRIQTEDVQRLQKSNDEIQTRFSQSQKRLEEREARLRKVESENRDLLDEIHGLRKRNYELESQLDIAKSQLIDKDDVLPSRSSSSMDIGYSSQVTSSIYSVEIERLRKQYSEASTNASQLQKLLEDAQIRCDQVAHERDMIRIQMEDERTKYGQLQQYMQERENEYRKRESDILEAKSTETQRLTSESQRLATESQRLASAKTEHATQLQKEVEVRDNQLQQLSRELEGVMRQNHELAQRVETAEKAAMEAGARLERAAHEVEEAQQTHIRNRQEREQREQEIGQFQQQAEKMRKDFAETKSRVTTLTRQLQETQIRCDEIAQERDALRRAVQEAHDSSGTAHTNLSRELERLHRERDELAGRIHAVSQERDNIRENMQREMSRREQEYKAKLNQENQRQRGQNDERRAESVKLAQELELKDRQLQQFQGELERIHAQNQKMEQTIIDLSEKAEAYKGQCERMSAQLEGTRGQEKASADEMQRALAAKESEVQHLKQVLDVSRQEFKKLEHHFARRKSQDQNAHRESTEMVEELQRQVELKDGQIRQVTAQLERSAKEIEEQESIIRQLSERLEHMMSRGGNPGTQNGPNDEAIRMMQLEITQAKKAIQERDQRIHKLETECFQQQAEEIERLRREIRSLSTSGGGGGRGYGPPQPPPHSNGASPPGVELQELKGEIDMLKRELVQKTDIIASLERECAEKHIRRIETLQTKLKRSEDEIASLHRGLDEQRRAIEERDRLIKQVRSESQRATSVELEQLRNEHAHCQDQLRKAGQEISQREKLVRNLEGQLDKQMEEVLEMKQEALTAAICEKDANIALLEMTGVKNQASRATLDKLGGEKSKLQTQLKQLAQTRAKLQEERKAKQRQQQQQ